MPVSLFLFGHLQCTVHPQRIYSVFKNQMNLNDELNEESNGIWRFIILDVIRIAISLEKKRPVWCLKVKAVLC